MTKKIIYERDDRLDITNKCSVCNKPLMKTDAEYSKFKYGKITCRVHSPYGTPPLHERFKLTTDDGLQQAREAGTAEGRTVSGLRRGPSGRTGLDGQVPTIL